MTDEITDTQIFDRICRLAALVIAAIRSPRERSATEVVADAKCIGDYLTTDAS